eukprot:6101937-Pyramimonas_sp.AAC.1
MRTRQVIAFGFKQKVEAKKATEVLKQSRTAVVRNIFRHSGKKLQRTQQSSETLEFSSVHSKVSFWNKFAIL